MNVNFYYVRNRCQIEGYHKILIEYFGEKKIGFLVDVGAHDGFKWSNSYPLTRVGWTGILIEPHPEYLKRMRILYKNRPDIKIIDKAMSNYVGEAILHDAGSLTTLKTEMLDAHKNVRWAKGKDQNKIYTVNVEKLDNILHENNVIPGFDLFTLDCEGSEEDVLECFDIDHWVPRMVIVETMEKTIYNERSILDMKGGDFYKFCDDIFIGKGYKKIHADQQNTIYVK